jgi:hypothetical protein
MGEKMAAGRPGRRCKLGNRARAGKATAGRANQLIPLYFATYGKTANL